MVLFSYLEGGVWETCVLATSMRAQFCVFWMYMNEGIDVCELCDFFFVVWWLCDREYKCSHTNVVYFCSVVIM